MKKYIAPVVSALVVIALAVGYTVFFFFVLRNIDMTNVIRYIIAGIALFVIIGIGAALVSRIKELHGGQEDDIGKY